MPSVDASAIENVSGLRLLIKPFVDNMNMTLAIGSGPWVDTTSDSDDFSGMDRNRYDTEIDNDC